VGTIYECAAIKNARPLQAGHFCVLEKLRTDWMASAASTWQSGSQRQGSVRTLSWLWKRWSPQQQVWLPLVSSQLLASSQRVLPLVWRRQVWLRVLQRQA
jgi:hypothetical protein